MGSCFEFCTTSPNISTNFALTIKSSFPNIFLHSPIPSDTLSSVSAIRRCSEMSGSGISIFSTIDFDISLKVAPRPKELSISVLLLKNQNRYLLWILSEQIRFLNPWLQYISVPAIAVFPIGALEERITVPAGKGERPHELTPAFVIFRLLSLITTVSSFNSAGVIQLILPSQYSETLVFGVVPETIVHTSPSFAITLPSPLSIGDKLSPVANFLQAPRIFSEPSPSIPPKPPPTLPYPHQSAP